MANPAASPTVSSTVGLKNMVIAPLTADTEETLTYGALQLVAGAIEAPRRCRVRGCSRCRARSCRRARARADRAHDG